MGKQGYVPRLSVEIRDDQLSDLQELLDHGDRKRLFGFLVDDVIKMLRKNREGFLMAVYARAMGVKDFSIKMGGQHGDGSEPAQVNSGDGGRRTTDPHPSGKALEEDSKKGDKKPRFKDEEWSGYR